MPPASGIQDIGHDGYRRRITPRSFPAEEGGTEPLSGDFDRVDNPGDLRQGKLFIDQGGAYPHREVLLAAACDAQHAYRRPQSVGVKEVDRIDLGDTLGGHLLRLGPSAEGEGGQDRQFVGGIPAGDIE